MTGRSSCPCRNAPSSSCSTRFRSAGPFTRQYAKGHKYLTLLYQIDQGITRLLWVGKERTIESFQGFFAVIRDQLAAQIQFVCSDMWQP
ncbi:MAG: transposase [Bryobacteraceae bacterium]